MASSRASFDVRGGAVVVDSLDEALPLANVFAPEHLCLLARWRELRAAEVAVDEVTEAFGEDPAVPDVRALLDHCREELEALHRDAENFVGPFHLEEPGHEELTLVRRLVEVV